MGTEKKAFESMTTTEQETALNEEIADAEQRILEFVKTRKIDFAIRLSDIVERVRKELKKAHLFEEPPSVSPERQTEKVRGFLRELFMSYPLEDMD